MYTKCGCRHVCDIQPPQVKKKLESGVETCEWILFVIKLGLFITLYIAAVLQIRMEMMKPSPIGYCMDISDFELLGPANGLGPDQYGIIDIQMYTCSPCPIYEHYYDCYYVPN